MIDVHAHVFFDELLGAGGAIGPFVEGSPQGNTLVTGGHRWAMGSATSLATTAALRVAQLDDAGIDRQVLSLSPLWLLHHTPIEIAGPFLSRANDLLGEFCAAAPDRLLGLAAVPAQHCAAAVSELERATSELGLVGAYFGTDAVAGLDEPALDDLYAACVALDVPLAVHSTVAGVDGPAGDPRLERWLGQVTLGYPYEEVLAVQALVLGGVVSRHPELDVLLPHGGGAFPMLHGRLRSFVETPASPISVEAFDAAVGRLWFDTHVHSAEALRLLSHTANPERLVLGTNFGGWDAADLAEVAELATVLDGNAARLLRLTRPVTTMKEQP